MKEGTWECPICGHENREENEICEECGSLREEPAYDAYADEMDEEEMNDV